jgi:hypothetical protein
MKHKEEEKLVGQRKDGLNNRTLNRANAGLIWEGKYWTLNGPKTGLIWPLSGAKNWFNLNLKWSQN